MASKFTYSMLWLLVFSIPFENMLVIQEFGTITRLVGMLAMTSAIFTVLIDNRFRPFGIFLTLFMVFVLWNMTTFYWSIDSETTLRFMFTYLQLFLLAWIIWEFGQTDQQLMSLQCAYVLGAYVSSLALFHAFLQGNQVTYFRYAAYGFDPNDIALIIALGVPLAWYVSLLTDNRLMVWLYRSYLPVAFFAVTLTASRASFIALMVAYCFVLWTYSNLSLLSKAALLLLVVFSGYFLLSLIPDYSWARLSTIGSEIASGNLNSRLAIWLGGLKAFAHNPLLGIGVGTFPTGVLPYLGVEISPHNLFLSILVGQGLIGIFIFASLITVLVVSAWHLPQLKFRLCIILLATWMTGIMALGWEHRKPTWFILSLVACLCALGKDCSRAHPSQDLEIRPLEPSPPKGINL